MKLMSAFAFFGLFSLLDLNVTWASPNGTCKLQYYIADEYRQDTRVINPGREFKTKDNVDLKRENFSSKDCFDFAVFELQRLTSKDPNKFELNVDNNKGFYYASWRFSYSDQNLGGFVTRYSGECKTTSASRPSTFVGNQIYGPECETKYRNW